MFLSIHYFNQQMCRRLIEKFRFLKTTEDIWKETGYLGIFYPFPLSLVIFKLIQRTYIAIG